MHEVLVNRLRGLSLPRKSVVRLTDRPDMTLDVYRGRKTNGKNTMYMRVDPFSVPFNCLKYFIDDEGTRKRKSYFVERFVDF